VGKKQHTQIEVVDWVNLRLVKIKAQPYTDLPKVTPAGGMSRGAFRPIQRRE